ncbi:hypothetical protein [Streptomyces sp. NPDC050704]|uniref:hypothetical protein n=1 Tax=Streptomyces sp. NPDC050704 TaxID=3157219 RepID=UPI003421E691
MTIKRHVATIDLLCSLAFPEEHGSSDVGIGGPGFHLAELESSYGLAEGDGSQREETAEQFEAYVDHISQRLSDRWGKPYRTGLDGVLIRSSDPDESIPEPWSLFSRRVGNMHLWQSDGTGRWIAVGVSRPSETQEIQLVVLVTEMDPP